MFTALPFLEDKWVLMCYTLRQQVTDAVWLAKKPQCMCLNSIKIWENLPVKITYNTPLLLVPCLAKLLAQPIVVQGFPGSFRTVGFLPYLVNVIAELLNLCDIRWIMSPKLSIITKQQLTSTSSCQISAAFSCKVVIVAPVSTMSDGMSPKMLCRTSSCDKKESPVKYC